MLSEELHTFIVTCESGSFTKAADRLFLSPPAVMKQINRLEEKTGFRLFVRSNHGLILTKAGQSFYQGAIQLFSDYDKYIKRAKQLSESESHIIRLGNSILRPCKPLIDLWNKENPDSGRFKFRIVPFDDNADNMDRIFQSFGRDFDILIGICDLTSGAYRAMQSLEISRMPFRIGVPYGHPLSEKDSLVIEDLFHRHLMLLSPGISGLIDRLHAELTEKYPQIIIDSSPEHYDIEMFNRCVEDNILILTNDTWADAHPSLKTVPISWDYYTTFGVMYPAAPDKDTSLFIDTLRKHLSTIYNIHPI